MKVLLISFFNPLEATSGSGLRSNSFLKNLSDLGCGIDLFAFSDAMASPPLPESAGLRVRLVKKKPNPKIVAFLRFAFFRKPLAVAEYVTREAVAAFREFAGGGDYDLVIFDNLFTYEFGRYLARNKHRVVINEHNAEYVMSHESFLEKKTLFKKVLTYFNTEAIKRYEFNALKEADCVVHVSAHDLRQFDRDRAIAAKSIVIPNTLPEKRPYALKTNVPNDILFVGSMSHYPNVEGILHFIENVWQCIHSERKDINLLIAGKNPPADLLRYDGEYNIKILGFVEDIGALYRRVKIAITPINIGSGTRLKILEAMMNGTLNISSRKGAEGLEVEDGRNIVIADDTPAWVNNILLYLDNNDKRLEIENEAYELVVDKYLYANYREDLRKIIAS